MPLVVLCGYPCSGKTTRCNQLKQFFEEHSKNVHVVSENRAVDDVNAVYRDPGAEKTLRGTLKSSVERLISRDGIVILDAMNYIKGYRYELYCIAKAQKALHCIVFCDTPEGKCSQWNSYRQAGQQYDEIILKELVSRFEAPEGRNRWDCPLFSIGPDDVLAGAAIAETLLNRRPPLPNNATLPTPLSSTNFLHELDRITQDVVRRASESLRLQGPGVELNVDCASSRLRLTKAVSDAQLQRLRRQFITLTKMHPVDDTSKIGSMFVTFLNETI